MRMRIHHSKNILHSFSRVLLFRIGLVLVIGLLPIWGKAQLSSLTGIRTETGARLFVDIGPQFPISYSGESFYARMSIETKQNWGLSLGCEVVADKDGPAGFYRTADYFLSGQMENRYVQPQIEILNWSLEYRRVFDSRFWRLKFYAEGGPTYNKINYPRITPYVPVAPGDPVEQLKYEARHGIGLIAHGGARFRLFPWMGIGASVSTCVSSLRTYAAFQFGLQFGWLDGIPD